MTSWMVTGGAGYIGAHVVAALRASGRDAVVYDDFSTGLERRVPADVPVVRGRIQDQDALQAAFADYSVDGVIHLAAKKAVAESVERPLYYYEENVGGMRALLDAMRRCGVRNFVYSSSAAVYGDATAVPIDESSALQPTSPYGRTKVVGEWMARDCGIAEGLSWIALRYFNVAGSGADHLGDSGVANLIPMVFRALDLGQRPQVFGNDYPTPDGTCIRDYVHVADLADAHVVAAARCEAGGAATAFNVGRGIGASVLEVLAVIEAVVGGPLNAQIVGRRPGDPAVSFASTDRIAAELGWKGIRDLHDMVASARSAWRRYAAA